jgi:tetratricopeptide (TPR) repeat protein
MLVVVILASTWAEVRGDASPNRDLYRSEQVTNGARTLPVLAQIAYRNALADLENGDSESAQKQLRLALRYDPEYSDAYFTMARIRAVELEPDAPVYLIQALEALLRTFRTQKLLAVNGAAALTFLLIALNIVACFAFAVKYLPFIAHKLREFLGKRFNTAFPGFVSYLILLAPVVAFAGTVIPLAYLTALCWLFMYRRERVLIVALIVPLAAAGIVDRHVQLAATLANPKSLTSLIDRANNGAGDEYIITELNRVNRPGLEAEKNLALGILYYKKASYYDASEHLFESISLQPENPANYINLGNVHFMQEEYEKALQGYRKAEGIDPTDAVCQFNLAQAYIKTLLMKKASRSLHVASEAGIEIEKNRYATDTRDMQLVYPKLFSNTELWRIALKESRQLDESETSEALTGFAGAPRRPGAILLVLTLVIALAVSRLIDPEKLTFQCSNCGSLTCSNCCRNDRDMSLCPNCADTIKSVTSEKVVDALLRQKRQSVLLRRKKSTRIISMVLPGVRDIFYGRIGRAAFVGGMFSLSLAFLIFRGAIVKDPLAVVTDPPLWKLVLPVLGIVWSYVLSGASKPDFKFRAQRHRGQPARAVDTGADGPSSANAA